MERRTASIIYLVYVHSFQLYEIVKGRRLIALSSNVKNIGAIHILGRVVSVHFLHQNFYEFVIPVVGSKVQCCKLFVC
jgi:hypothetical protein